MLQDDLSLAEAVKSWSEQLESVHWQLSNHQATIAKHEAIHAEREQKIDELTKNNLKQERQLGRLTDIVAQLTDECKGLAAKHANGTKCLQYIETIVAGV